MLKLAGIASVGEIGPDVKNMHRSERPASAGNGHMHRLRERSQPKHN